MSRLKFQIALAATILVSIGMQVQSQSKPRRQIYELMVYHVKDGSQITRMDKYLSKAYLPAAHRHGVKSVGVFKTAGIDTAAVKKMYVLMSYASLGDFQKIKKAINNDARQVQDGSEYTDAAYNNPTYIRKESILLEAFTGMPSLKKPEFTNQKSERIYELRSYESASEKIHQNKVKMFNDGDEIAIFENIGSQAVFYGEVLAGSKMPNLMYLTTYSNRRSRDEHWKSFSQHPKWKILSALPEYQNNVSHIDIDYLTPADYSDL